MNMVMTLDLPTGGGDFLPFVRYNAKSGIWIARIKGLDGKGDTVDIAPPRLAYDFPTIRTGWVAFVAGQGPKWIWDVPGQTRCLEPPPIGNTRFRIGFIVNVYGSDNLEELGGERLGLREFSGSSQAIHNAIRLAFDEWANRAPEFAECVPVFRLEGKHKLGSGEKVSYQPIYKLDKYVPRDSLSPFIEAEAKARAASVTSVTSSGTSGMSASNGAAPRSHSAPHVPPPSPSKPAASFNMNQPEF